MPEAVTTLPRVEVRISPTAGRGVFAAAPIAAGTLVLHCTGELLPADQVRPEHYGMMVDQDLWLCSLGVNPDDFLNHSCAPNVGFSTGEPAFYSLRDIAAEEELVWDYSTSMSDATWQMPCCCPAADCRQVIRPFPHLSPDLQARLSPISLAYLRHPRFAGGATTARRPPK